RGGFPNFGAAINTRITVPLGMSDTSVAWTPALRARAANQDEPNGYIVLDGGGGGIKSTTHDLLLFESAFLGLKPTTFGPALTKAMTPQFARNAREAIGLFWDIDRTKGFVSKSGKVNGSLAFLMLSPQNQAGVAICCLQGVHTRLKGLAKQLLAT